MATATTLVLVLLGSGLGFAALSPWPGHGVSPTTFAVTSAIWLIVTQWISSCLGGYIAGRLRTRWIGTHAHEVFFRDTAHGFITWAVATVLVAAVFASSVLSTAGSHEAAMSEASATLQSALPQADAGRPQRERRIDEPAMDRADVDAARKAAAEAAIYTALSMLVGAFIASVSAALGGRLRDQHP